MAERIVVLGRHAGRITLPEETTAVAAGCRHLEDLDTGLPTIVLDRHLESALDEIAAVEGCVTVLASGDPGFFGILRLLAERFGPGMLEVRPAPSSVALAFARVGLPWDDALVVSAHGRDPRPAVAACLAHPKVAVLCGPGAGPAALAGALAGAGCADRDLVVCERLAGPDERVVEGGPGDIARGSFADTSVLLVLDPGRPRVAEGPVSVAGAGRPPASWALPVEAFAHRDGLISKPEVRALALARLAPRAGRLVWDVGAGCGSVAVECARFGAGVLAVERDPDQLELLAANTRAHGVAVQAVAGAAPGVLADLPDPDAVFVGGGGEDLPAILDVVLDRARATVVVPLATLERIGPTLRRLRDAGWAARGEVVQVHEVAALGAGHRLAPRNPVALITGERP